jgi:hypothetical protein
METSTLTVPEDELLFAKEAESFPTLGPNYFAARTIAERFMEHFAAEHFEPLIKQFSEKFRDELWTYLQSWLIGDTESNLQCEIRYRIDRAVDNLLAGNKQALDQYVFAQYNHEDVRKAIAAHVPKEIQDARVADLEAQVSELKQSLKYYQELRNY